MIVARWHIHARFGHKQNLIEMLNRWNEEFGSKIGWTAGKSRMLTGSVGAAESLVVSEIQLENLAELDAAFGKLATLDGHAQWGKDLEPHIVSGSNHWEILRII